MNCTLCDNTTVVYVFEMEDDQRIVGREAWWKAGCPSYKHSFGTRCGRCFPEFVESQGTLINRMSDAKKSNNQTAEVEIRSKLLANWYKYA